MEDKNDNKLICGRNAVCELLRAQAADTLYIADESSEKYTYLAAQAREQSAVVKHVSSRKLDAMCGTNHQGVAALRREIAYCQLEDILDAARQKGELPFIVICDDIADPHNLGAIIRTAECAGAHGIVIPKRGGCTVTPTVFRTSAGAAAHIAIARMPNLAAAVRELKQAGVFVYSAEMGGACCYDTDLSGPVALVIGSEGFGVSRLLRELSDASVSLPLAGKINSLNASAAAAALIYETVRQRRR